MQREAEVRFTKIKEGIILILFTQSILHFPKGFVVGYSETFCGWGGIQV